MDLKRGIGNIHAQINMRAMGFNPYMYSHIDTKFGRMTFLTHPVGLVPLASQNLLTCAEKPDGIKRTIWI